MNHSWALRLELLEGLRLCPSEINASEWWHLLRPLRRQDARIVVLRIMHGMNRTTISERVEVPRSYVDWSFPQSLRRLEKSFRQLREAA